MKSVKAPQYCQLIETPIGSFRAVWTDGGLRSFEFLRDEQLTEWAAAAELPLISPDLQSAVDHYFQSGHFEWELDQLDWQGISPFQERVLRQCYLIPTATTQTYGELASSVGSPAAARAVGGAMARNRWPLLIPCHRVVGSSGKLTGYSGIGGIDTKRKLLELELEAVRAPKKNDQSGCPDISESNCSMML